ncbi:DUF4115 domain-containing protein [Gammaproteobacteria bacterium]|nr:DUF4115 domain-containing protein [Gammaproteobacteria bacterium]
MTLEAKSANSVKIGKVFEAGRIKAGFSKNEVAEASVINIKYIEAIESGDYSIFPSESFARAYFIKYQDFLSLNCDFPSIYDENLRKFEIIEKSITKFNSSSTPNIKKGGVILAVFIILFIVAKPFFFNQIDSEDVSKSIRGNIRNIDINEIPINTNLKITDNFIDSTELYEEADKTNNYIENRLTLTFSDECWIEVYSGDELVANQLFKSGDIYLLDIKKPFRVVVGNADHIKGTYNRDSIDFITNANRLRVNTIIFNDE